MWRSSCVKGSFPRQRVPKQDRMYSVPADEIGTYGGIGRQTMHFVFMGELALSSFGEREADGFTWRPFVGKSWEFSEDGRVLSFIMREGQVVGRRGLIWRTWSSPGRI